MGRQLMSAEFTNWVIPRYQQQIAKTYHQCLLASDPADRFNQANNLAEVIDTTLAAVAYGGYRDGPEQAGPLKRASFSSNQWSEETGLVT